VSFTGQSHEDALRDAASSVPKVVASPQLTSIDVKHLSITDNRQHHPTSSPTMAFGRSNSLSLNTGATNNLL